MMKLTYQIASVLVLVALVGYVLADEKKCCDGAKEGCAAAAKEGCDSAGEKGCAASGTAAAGCASAEGCPSAAGCAAAVALKGNKACPIETAMAKLPQISFAVGDKKVCCPKAAAGMAKASDAPIQFVVLDKTFAKESDAKLALVEATEKYVVAFAKPKKCSVSGTITVAGEKVGCEKMAAHRANVAKAAMDKVKFTYLVGEKECHCPVEAKEVAKKSGKDTLFVVGEEKTKCNVTARLNLAKAKYRAAIIALAVADAEAEADKVKAGAGA